MNDIIFSDNFTFNDFSFSSHHYTDNRQGVNYNFLAYMAKGHAEIVSDRKSIKISEGDIFYIPKNLSYQSYWYGNDEIRFLSFGFLELNTDDFASFELQTVPCFKETVDKITAIPIKRSIDCKALSLFYDVMSDILPNLKKSESKEQAFIRLIKTCIRKNPHLSLAEIAKQCYISEPYLYSLFKKNTQTSPNEYRQKFLCEGAIEFLVTTDKKIEEISRIMGFSSSSYFRKVFKKHTGKTPGEIRKNRTF
ncbi:MAG: AraC family transcriptional regulator [Clostridia bacterium]|nr:AraC family transcriptional regulator [Clostridia bacterium]